MTDRTDIVKLIQRCDTWGDVRADGMGDLYVPVFFKTMADAKAFKVELMVVASGQSPYGDDGEGGDDGKVG